MEIYYVNSKGEKIYFDRLPYLMLTDTNVFNYEWTYDIKNNNLYNIRRSLPTKDVSIVITGKDYENERLYCKSDGSRGTDPCFCGCNDGNCGDCQNAAWLEPGCSGSTWQTSDRRSDDGQYDEK